MPEFNDPNVQEERSFETGMDESMKAGAVSATRSWDANVKRTYDVIQNHYDILISRAQSAHDTERSRSQDAYDRLTAQTQAAWNNVEAARHQATLNMVEACKQLSQQLQRHNDFSIDRQWAGTDMAQTADTALGIRALTLDDASLKAIGAAVAAAVVEALGSNGGSGS